MNKKIIENNLKKVRDLINDSWKREMLFKDKTQWEKVCSSMDVLEDTQIAINSYFDLSDSNFDETGKCYLLLYGLLQAFFLQQDAINNLSQALFNKEIKWKEEYPSLFEIRKIRNDAIGHPTSRNNDESFHYISRNSLKKNSFELASFYPKKKSNFKDKIIDLNDIRNEQERVFCNILKNIIKSLKKELKEHKMQFKDIKLIDLIPKNFNYHLEKLYEGIFKNYPLIEINFKMIKESYEKIKNEIIKRYTSLDALEGVKFTCEEIDYTLTKIEGWIKNNNFYNNKDAKLFLDNFKFNFNEFIVILREIDKEFQCD